MYFDFSTDEINYSNKFTINSSGNVGIGTTTPNEKLTVEGHVNIGGDGNYRLITRHIDGKDFDSSDISDLHLNYNTGTDVIIGAFYSGSIPSDLKVSGNVGIGTSSPEETLHVNGTATIMGDIGVPTSNHWNTGSHTLELQNRDEGDVVLSFHRGGYSSASIKHTSQRGLVFSGSGGFNDNHLHLSNVGNLGIGTMDTQGFKLGVDGKIAATEVKVATYNSWSDFVFNKDYELPTLKEVEQHIKKKGHLENIPSAEEVKEDGFYLAEMNAKLLQKIEELTLYTIEQEKQLEAQNSKIEKLEKENKELKILSERVAKIEALLNNQKR